MNPSARGFGICVEQHHRLDVRIPEDHEHIATTVFHVSHQIQVDDERPELHEAHHFLPSLPF